MFETLIESRSGARRRAGGTVLSMLVHAMVVAGAVQATERVVTSAGLARSDTLKFVLARPERAATEVQDEAPLPGAPEVVSEVALPEMTPVGIPQVDLGARPFDAATVVGRQTTVGMTDVAGEKEQASGVAVVPLLWELLPWALLWISRRLSSILSALWCQHLPRVLAALIP